MAPPSKPRCPLNSLRRRFPIGLSIEQIQEILARDYDDPISLATIRKYVQLGLVERSTRRGMGYRQGSKGYYPVTALVQLVRLRALVRKSGLPAAMTRSVMEIHKHLDAMREALENALSGLIVVSRHERRAATAKPDLVRLRSTITDALDELGSLAAVTDDGDEEAA